MDGTTKDAASGAGAASDVAPLIEELEAVDPAEAPPIAEQIADSLGAELDASADEPAPGEED